MRSDISKSPLTHYIQTMRVSANLSDRLLSDRREMIGLEVITA
jgi:hypothetical protein